MTASESYKNLLKSSREDDCRGTIRFLYYDINNIKCIGRVDVELYWDYPEFTEEVKRLESLEKLLDGFIEWTIS